MNRAIFHIPEDNDLFPVNEETAPPREMVAMVRRHLERMAVSQTTKGVGPQCRHESVARAREH